VNDITPKLKQKDNRSVYECTTCRREIHRDIVEGEKTPQTSIGLIGYTGHGKTVYITSLFYVLKFFQSSWPGYHYLCLDNEANTMVYERVRHFEENAELPPGTPINFPHPHLISYSSLPHFGDVRLTYYDVGGQVYENPASISDQGRFVAHADTIFFLLSITEFGPLWTSEIQKRLDIYVNAVKNSMRVDTKKNQNLVVVLTKADLLTKKLSEPLQKHVFSGDYTRYNKLKEAFSEMRMSTKQIRKSMMDEQAGGFINLAESSFRRVEYCMVSSTGSDPVKGRLASKLNPKDPKRMLDPLLWALQFKLPSNKTRNLLRIAVFTIFVMFIFTIVIKGRLPAAAKEALPQLFQKTGKQ
jgi:hypothetical protein